MNHSKTKYRLRLNARIIGYATQTESGLDYKGREPFHGMRGKPNYNQIDLFTGVQDKFHRDIYENDLVNYRINSEFQMRKGIVSFDESNKSFGITDLASGHFTLLFLGEICLFHSEKMEVYSHLFNHPEMERFIS